MKDKLLECRALWDHAPVAQLDRVPGYELGGREFESLRAHQKNQTLTSIFNKLQKFLRCFSPCRLNYPTLLSNVKQATNLICSLN
jgi:hypothetical protein